MKDPQTIAAYIQCLSVFETNTYHLYQTLADKVQMPLAIGLLYGIAMDSQKHSMLLKTISECIDVPEKKIKSCEKKLSKTLRIITSFHMEIKARERINHTNFPRTADNLSIIAAAFGEEYRMISKTATLQYLVNGINKKSKVNLKDIQSIFDAIIAEQSQHTKLLAIVQVLLRSNIPKKADCAITVKFQNPDRWTQTLPSATYN